ncbi:hypothetical protein BGX38DRAFT_1101760 [Terfezia claveryi]|nr:hypothetical protein BGX38DRAFT_1101760 [Terfezia claveryi]
MRTVFLASLLLGTVTSLTVDPAAPDSLSADTTGHRSKHCKLLSSVTYYDPWGPLFVENSYACDLGPLHPHKPTAAYPILPIQPYPTPHPRAQKPRQQRLPLPPTVRGRLPTEKHQIISYGCATPPHASPLDQSKVSSLLYSLPQLTNQSCIPPGQLREYKEYHQPWGADWAFTNFNRGEEEICDWYWELGQVANALHMYCEHSFERKQVDGKLTEVFAYGRDREREESGGQLWCLRYSKKGWEEKLFGEKCLGMGLKAKGEMVEEEL